MLLRSNSTRRLVALLQSSGGSFSVAAQLALEIGEWFTVIDVDDDGQLDVVVVEHERDTLLITNLLTATTALVPRIGFSFVGSADFNGDGKR